MITYGHHRPSPIDIGNEKDITRADEEGDRMKRPQLMTAKQMAKYLQISEVTVRHWADQGLIGKLQPGGKGYAVRYFLLEEELSTKHAAVMQIAL